METLTPRRLLSLAIVVVCCLLLARPASTDAQVYGGGMPAAQTGDAYAYESITVATVAIGFTAATLSPSNAPSAKAAIITVEPTASSDFRYRFDGSDPSTTEGHLVTIATPSERVLVVVGINNLRRFRAIRTGGVSAVLKVTYIR